jgi:two-component system, sensor histidine kinase and response regulator
VTRNAADPIADSPRGGDEMLRVLLVEDDPVDAVLVESMLAEGHRTVFCCTRASTLSQARARLAESMPACVLVDLGPPDSRGLASLDKVLEAAPGAAVVALTGVDDERIGQAAIVHGAQDYLVKGKINAALLARSLDSAVARKRAEETLRQLNVELDKRVRERTAELEEANKELETFAYSVSHDLRAPLRSIDGFSQALLEDYADKLDAAGQEFLQRIVTATERMTQLIDDLLKLSRVTRADMHLVQVDLSKLAASISQELRESKPNRRTSICVAHGLVTIGDPILLRALLENLLANAWKFSASKRATRIEVGSACIAGETAYFVRDNGVGFDMAYVGKLFAPFQRLHSQSEFAGTGIGLATVQRIVRRHGGRVWAEARPGKGATFWFTLRRAAT